MRKLNESTNCKNSGFVIASLSAFDFLEKEYQFRCVTSKRNIVNYRSDKVYIGIYYDDQNSYEINLTIGQLRKSLFNLKELPGFDMADIIALAHAQKETGYTFFQASKPEDMKELVFKLAEYLKKYAEAGLKGDKLFFKKLEKIHSDKSLEETQNILIKQIRGKAEKAWREGDYTEFIELYKPIMSHITQLEKQKIEYAQKKRNSMKKRGQRPFK